MQTLSNLFERYALAFGQHVSPHKSTLYSPSILNARMLRFASFLGFNIGRLPFIYLGALIFKGKAKFSTLLLFLIEWNPNYMLENPISSLWLVDLSLLKVSCIICLPITSPFMLWLVSLIKDFKKALRNFIWTGSQDKRKMVIVSWFNVCKSFNEAGFGLRSLSILNEASNLKLCWEYFTSHDQWAVLLRLKTWKNGCLINYHISSSIWSGIKAKFQTVLDNSSWNIGKGENVSPNFFYCMSFFLYFYSSWKL